MACRLPYDHHMACGKTAVFFAGEVFKAQWNQKPAAACFRNTPN
jgi:hypothetical protein